MGFEHLASEQDAILYRRTEKSMYKMITRESDSERSMDRLSDIKRQSKSPFLPEFGTSSRLLHLLFSSATTVRTKIVTVLFTSDRTIVNGFRPDVVDSRENHSGQSKQSQWTVTEIAVDSHENRIGQSRKWQ